MKDFDLFAVGMAICRIGFTITLIMLASMLGVMLFDWMYPYRPHPYNVLTVMVIAFAMYRWFMYEYHKAKDDNKYI